ncbi:uncharacterized protein B0H18DRAFT_1014286 [Fomitopsis serialis]|uniref:uncharacterized protein n=1 Tax=Fomitopsis serialis TaxID=139415 RepID=UPI0020084771|nr:uncharacterized protein B0H18DRAFT_1014286 [Neoantrodia serialis]KAH9923617.1 hypothetical protein B0H18DRAFT_1014286 [Neoantrodia serialis]
MLARPLRLSCPPPALRHARTYVVNLDPPRVYPNKPGPRKYGARKNHLFNKYTHLIESSSQKPVLLFLHSGFTVPRLLQLRLDIAKAAARHASTPSLAGPSPTPAPEPPAFTVIRSSIFGVVLRDFATLDRQSVVDVASNIEGGLAALSFPNLNPPQLNAILKTLEKALPPPPKKTEADLERERNAAAAAFVPGRRPKRQRPTPVPQLKLVGALIEGRLFQAPGVLEVAKLPTLDTLRAQLVGMLSAPAMQLAMVLGEASGAKLHRTLEGLRRGLEERDGGAKEEEASAGSSP